MSKKSKANVLINHLLFLAITNTHLNTHTYIYNIYIIYKQIDCKLTKNRICYCPYSEERLMHEKANLYMEFLFFNYIKSLNHKLLKNKH